MLPSGKLHTTAGFKHVRERQGKEGSEMPNKHVGPESICSIKRSTVKPLKFSVQAKWAFMTQTVPNWRSGGGLTFHRTSGLRSPLLTLTKEGQAFLTPLYPQYAHILAAEHHSLSPALQCHVPEAANWLDPCPAK